MEPDTVKVVQDTAATAAAAGWLRLAHVLGALIYSGGLLVVAKLLGGLAGMDPKARQPAAAIVRSAYLGVVMPAFVFLFFAGLHNAIMDPMGAEIIRQPWFHMKLTVAFLVFIVDHMLVGRPLKGLAKGTADPKAQEAMYGAAFKILAALFFVIAVSLYVLRK